MRLVVDRRPYSLSWNGQRLARGRDVARLARDWPELLEHLVAYLEQGARR